MTYDAILSSIIQPFFLFLFCIPVIWSQNPVAGLTLAYTATAFGALLVGFRYFRRHFSLRRSLAPPSKAASRSFAAFSTPLGLHDLIQYSGIRAELLILAAFVSAEEGAVYFLVAELSQVIRKFRQIGDAMIIPMVSEMESAEDYPRIRENIARIIRWILLPGILYLGAMGLFGRPFLGIYGDEFSRGATCLLILCLAQLIDANTGVLDLIQLASGRTRINLLNACILLVSQVALGIWIIPQTGILGAALVKLLSASLIGIVRIAQSFLILKLNPFHPSQLKPIAAGTLSAALTYAARHLLPFAKTPFAWVGFCFLFLLAFGLALNRLNLEEEDRFLLRSITGKITRRIK